MSLGARLFPWFCLASPAALIAAGLAVHLLVLGPRAGWMVHVAAQALLFSVFAAQILDWRRRPGGGRPPDAAGPAAADPAAAGQAAAGQAALARYAPAPPIMAPKAAWILLGASLALDLAHLADGGRHYSPLAVQGFFPVFFPTIWAAFAAALGYAALLGPAGDAGPPGAPEAAGASGGRPAARPGPLAALAAVSALAVHLALTVLGHDVYSARGQAGIALLWGLIFGGSKWARLAVLAVAAAYLPLEGAVAGTGLYARLADLDFMSPLSGMARALDQSLREAAWLSSGSWGLGPQHLGSLGFVGPEMMRLHALSYLAAAAGRGGLLIYACLSLGLIFGVGWLAVRRGPEARVAALAPAWLLVASHQYLGLLLFMGWRVVGLTYPPAFIGGAGTGLGILLLGVIVLRTAPAGGPPAGLGRPGPRRTPPAEPPGEPGTDSPAGRPDEPPEAPDGPPAGPLGADP